MSRWRVESGYLGRYIGSGALNTVVGFAVIIAMTAAGASPYLANIAGYAVGLALGFWTARKFVFRSTGFISREGWRYLLAFGTSWLLNLLILHLSMKTMGLQPMIAQAVAAVVYSGAMYLLGRLLVFSSDEAREDKLRRLRAVLGATSHRADVVALFLLLMMALLVGGKKYQEESYFFYQSSFGPAVMTACGHGYVNVDRTSPEVKEFLERKISQLDCSQVLENEVPFNDALHRTSRYFIESVGWYWKLFGISWPGLIPYFVGIYLLTVFAAYAINRIIFSPIVAALGVMMVLPALNKYLWLFRDFAKAFFIYFVLAAAIYLVVRWPRDHLHRFFQLCAATGVVTGVGLGFRSDLLIYVPFFALVVVLFVPQPHAQNPWLEKFKGIGLFFLCFMVMGWPVLSTLGQGSNFGHFFLLGRTLETLGWMSVNSVAYDFGRPHLDEYIFQLTYAWSAWQTQSPVHLGVGNPGYDKATMTMVKEILFGLPADMFSEGVHSVLGIVRYWWPIFLVSFVGLLWWSRRIFFFVLFGFLWLTAYPFIQFNERHFFFLYILHPIAFFGAVYVVFKVWRLVKAGTFFANELSKTNVRPVLVTLGALVLVYTALAVVLGAWQSNYLMQQRHLYLTQEASTQGIEISEKAGLAEVRVLPSELHGQYGEYLRFEVSPQCPQETITMQIGYEYLSHPHVIRNLTFSPKDTVAVVFPVLGMKGMSEDPSAVASVYLDQAALACLSVGKFLNPEQFSLPLTWVIHRSEKEPLYKEAPFFRRIRHMLMTVADEAVQLTLLLNR